METTQAVATLGALAQETRLEIVRLLIRHGEAGLPAGRIGEALGLNPATLSFHLAALRNAGVVSSVRASRQIVYSANFATVTALVDYLLENCCSECPPGSCEERPAAGAKTAAGGRRTFAPARGAGGRRREPVS